MNWYEIQNPSEVASPAILIYPDRVAQNLRSMIDAFGGSAHRLRPHVKTHKLPQIIELKRSFGIDKFKVSTIAEAEMTAAAGGKDILVAYPIVGPNIDRLIALIQRFPESKFSGLVDDLEIVNQIEIAARQSNCAVSLLLDLNIGMNRTGIRPNDPRAIEIYRKLCNSSVPSSTSTISCGGLHAYEGHLHDSEISQLQNKTELAYEPVWDFIDALRSESLPVPKLITSGTPTSSILATSFHDKRIDIEVSAGTSVLWDAGQPFLSPDSKFINAAVLLTRVISRPGDDLICIDLGHKAIASEMPPPRAAFLGLEDAVAVMHSEEHLVLRTKNADRFRPGDVLYAIPQHVCPTVALYDFVHVIRNHLSCDTWKVIARTRKISI